MVSRPTQENGGALWPTIWWLLGSVWAPITLPWIIYQMLWTLHQKYKCTSLTGKVVLITGASSGLGEALAHEFYKNGCRVVLAARRKEELERVKQSLLETHTTVPTHLPVVLPLDLSDLDSLPKHVQHVLSMLGRIDILINNGGISYRGEIINTNLETDQKIMLVNYFGQVALTKAVLPHMLERNEGHIVTISSIQGRIALPKRSAYAASKHALQAFCDSLRAELDPHIKVTVVNPGYIRTSLSVNALTGSGTAYGKMDETTENGYSSEYVAKEVLKAVAVYNEEINVAPLNAKAATFLRTVMPSIFFWIMAKRAKKS